MNRIATKLQPFVQSNELDTLGQLEDILREKGYWAMATPPYPVSHGEVHIEAVMNNVANLLSTIDSNCPGHIDSGSVFQLGVAVLVHDLGMGAAATHTEQGSNTGRQKHASLKCLQDYLEHCGIKAFLSANDFHYATLIAWAHAGDDEFSSEEKADWVDDVFRFRTGAKFIPLCMRLLRFADLCDVGPDRLNPLPRSVTLEERQRPHREKHEVAKVVLADRFVEIQLACPVPKGEVVKVRRDTYKALVTLRDDIERQFYELHTWWLRDWRFMDELRPGAGDARIGVDAELVVSVGNDIVPELSINVGVSVAVVVTPDGSNAICRGKSDEKLVSVWDLRTCQCNKQLEGHDGKINGLAITKGGDKVVSTSSDKTVRIWNLEKAECDHTLTGHTDEVRGVAIAPDGRTLVSASYDRTLRSWSMLGDGPGHEFKGHLSKISNWAVCITHAGDRIVSGDNEGQLRIWNISDDSSRVFEVHNKRIYGIAVAPDDEHVIVGCDDSSVERWNISTAEHSSFEGHDNEVNDVIMTEDGRMVITSSDDTTIKVWDFESSEHISTLRGHTKAVLGLAIFQDHDKRDWLFSTSKDGTLKRWPLYQLRRTPVAS